MKKMAKPAGLIVKCPNCGEENTIEAHDLCDNDFPCQLHHCNESFATCGEDDFYRYIRAGGRRK